MMVGSVMTRAVALCAGVITLGVAYGSLAQVDEFPVANDFGDPVGITVGPDRAIWFTERSEAKIGRLATDAPHQLSTFALPAGSSPKLIITGADGRLWFTENVDDVAGRIGRLSVDGELQEFPLSTLPTNVVPVGIAVGSDSTVWFSAAHPWDESWLGHADATGILSWRELPRGQVAGQLTTGPDGNVWFTSTNAVGRITAANEITIFPVRDSGFPLTAIAAGVDSVWFADYGNRVGRVGLDGAVTEFQLPGVILQLTALALGPDGNIWATEFSPGNVDRITPSGVVTQYGFPYYCLNDIVKGPDDYLWFTAACAGNLVRMAPGAPTPTVTATPTPVPTVPLCSASRNNEVCLGFCGPHLQEGFCQVSNPEYYYCLTECQPPDECQNDSECLGGSCVGNYCCGYGCPIDGPCACICDPPTLQAICLSEGGCVCCDSQRSCIFGERMTPTPTPTAPTPTPTLTPSLTPTPIPTSTPCPTGTLPICPLGTFISCDPNPCQGCKCIPCEPCPPGEAFVDDPLRCACTPASPTPTPTLPASECVGDCRGDRQVTIDEIITMVGIALGGCPSGGSCCASIEAWCSSGPAGVTVTCIIEAVNNALSGCPMLPPTPPPTLPL